LTEVSILAEQVSQHPSERPLRGEVTVSRLEVFCDAVYAIAMTLLVLGLVIPRVTQVSGDPALLRHLAGQWPAFASFALSFLLVGQVWTQHHRLLANMRQADHGLVWLNFLLLLDVVLIPFVTGLLGEYAGRPGERVAGVAYGLTWTIGGVFFNAVWWWGRRRGLLHPELPPAVVRATTIRWALGPSMYLVSTLLVLVQFWVGVAGFLCLLALYLVPPPRLRPPR
jgi:uncharacterized membrane protein